MNSGSGIWSVSSMLTVYVSDGGVARKMFLAGLGLAASAAGSEAVVLDAERGPLPGVAGAAVLGL